MRGRQDLACSHGSELGALGSGRRQSSTCLDLTGSWPRTAGVVREGGGRWAGATGSGEGGGAPPAAVERGAAAPHRPPPCCSPSSSPPPPPPPPRPSTATAAGAWPSCATSRTTRPPSSSWMAGLERRGPMRERARRGRTAAAPPTARASLRRHSPLEKGCSSEGGRRSAALGGGEREREREREQEEEAMGWWG